MEQETQQVRTEDSETLSVSVSPDSSLTSPVSAETEKHECQKLELIVQKDVLKQFVREVMNQNDECKLVFNVNDGLRTRVVDPAHVSMTDTCIAREVFESVWYDPHTDIAEYGDILAFGIDIAKLMTFLKTEKAKDAIIELTVEMMSADLEGPARSRMTVKGPTGTRVMSLIDITGMTDPKIPDLANAMKLKAYIEDPKLFRQQLKSMETVSDHVGIRYSAEDGKLYLECEGDMDKVVCEVSMSVEYSRATTRQIKGLEGEIINVQTEDVKSLFPLGNLIGLAKVLPGPFSLEIGNDYPLIISYGRTRMLLAPRIESGD